MILSDFEPGIFIFLLWGLISWVMSKKKKKIRTDTGETVTKPKEDLFARLRKLQEHLSMEMEIFPSTPHTMKAEEGHFTEDDEYGFEEVEIPITETEDVHEDEGCVFETDIKIPAAGSDNWIKQNLSRKSNLRELMVLKEVLGEPRSLKPYIGDYFQSQVM